MVPKRDERYDDRGWMRILVVGTALGLMLSALRASPAWPADDWVEALGALPAPGKQMPVDVADAGWLSRILDETPDGKTVSWRAGSPWATYRVQPLSTFPAADHSCRSFTVRLTAANSIRESYRIACRSADGSWELSGPVQHDGKT